MLKALESLGYVNPSPVQLRTIPAALRGESLLAQSETGSGKTHSYLIPIIENMSPVLALQAIVICPSRELSRQVYEFARQFCPFFEGLKVRLFTSEDEVSENREGLSEAPNLVIGTPGRLADLLYKEHPLDLTNVRTIVLDEADMLMELGYFDDVDRLLSALPEKKQVLVYSATLHVGLTSKLEKSFGTKLIFDGEKQKTAKGVRHHFVDIRHMPKEAALVEFIKQKRPYLCLAFSSTKEGVNKAYAALKEANIECLLFSGDLTDRERKRAIKEIKANKYQVIVCSDLLARGIDIEDVTDVVSIDLPGDLSYYFHRAGRSGRFGKEGDSYVFYDQDAADRARALMAKGVKPDFLTLRKDGLKPDPVGLLPKKKLTSKKELPADEMREIKIAKARSRPKKVKPGYKKKTKRAIERVKGKYRRKAINIAISKSKSKKD